MGLFLMSAWLKDQTTTNRKQLFCRHQLTGWGKSRPTVLRRSSSVWRKKCVSVLLLLHVISITRGTPPAAAAFAAAS